MREEITHPLRADFSKAKPDYTIDFRWDHFTSVDHAMWKFLFDRQTKILHDRACKEYLDGFKLLGIDENQIPNYEKVNETLFKKVGWKLVVVPGYLPGEVFLGHLAERRFPVTCFIRKPHEIDYLQEPDIFHDMFGHVPMLAHPIFADYMQAFGKGGVRAHELGHISLLDTLYWFTVEFGLINTKDGLRIYGSGIVSSKGESVYCLENDEPKRIPFDLKRIMRTQYRIDQFQKTYFVLDSFEQLIEATRPDFKPIYEEVAQLPPVGIGEVLPGETLIPAIGKRN